MLSSPSESFGPGLPPAHGDVPLAWWLLMAVAILLPFDIALRRLNLSHTEAWAWLLTAKARVLKGRVSREQEAESPVLENLRQRRAGRPRLNISGASRQESTATNPPVPGMATLPSPGKRVPDPRRGSPLAWSRTRRKPSLRRSAGCGPSAVADPGRPCPSPNRWPAQILLGPRDICASCQHSYAQSRVVPWGVNSWAPVRYDRSEARRCRRPN